MNEYIITDGEVYVRDTTGTIITSDRSKSYKWNKQEKALNVIKTLMSSNKTVGKINSIKDKLYVEPYDAGNDYNGKYMIDYIEDIANEDYSNINLNILEPDLDYVLNFLDNIPSQLENERLKARNDLIKCCKALTDIQHYKERKPRRSASAKCNLDTFETEILIKRRNIKHKLYKIEVAENKLKGINYNISNYNDFYRPRILEDLFMNDEIYKFDEWWTDETKKENVNE